MKTKNILLVEDNPDDEMLTIRAFEKVGYADNLHVVRDGAEAVDYVFNKGTFSDKLKNPRPDLIMLDLKLPKIDGREEISPGKSEKTIQRDGSKTVLSISEMGGRVRNIATDWTYGRDSFQTYVVEDDDPLKTTAAYETKAYFKRGDFEAGTHSEMEIRCDENYFI